MAEILSVIVGGAIAAASGVATQLSIHIIRTREERRNRMITKFEELIAAIYEHERWMDLKLHYHAFREGEIPGVNPIGTIQALCSIYFPQFVVASARMNRDALAYALWMTKAGKKRLAKQPDAMDGFDDAYNLYSDSSNAFLTALRGYGQEQFGPKTKNALEATK